MTTSPHSGSPLVVVEDIHLTLGSAAGPVNILRGISLAIGAGETVALLGPSGSGKSTLMMVAAGLERPSSGRVIIAGQDLGHLDEDGLARLRRRYIGIVFQAFHLIPTMTALENVAIPLELAGAADAFAAAAAALGRVGLAERLTHYPAQLSGGEQQRVAIARAFVAGPQLLLADEPTGNLDPDTAEKTLALLLRVTRAAGAAAIIVTHSERAARVADRCVMLGKAGLVPHDA
jgi:putative ABC transport system ATP-binding protein